MELDEKQLDKKLDMSAERYRRKFRAQIDCLEKYSPLAKIRGINAQDVVALGRMCEQYQDYQDFIINEAGGTAADLGPLPKIALDILTGSYGASIVPLLSSTQPLDEERGIVYFKTTKADTTRGNVTAEQKLRDAIQAPAVYPEGFAGEKNGAVQYTLVSGDINTFNASTGDVVTHVQSIAACIRPNTLRITASWDSTIQGFDDGNGKVYGVKCYGTVTYGALQADGSVTPSSISMKFATLGGIGATINYGYSTNYEANGASIPKIKTGLDSTDIEAEIFALATDMGLFKGFALKKRFGKNADDEMIQDLTGEINAEMGNALIHRIVLAWKERNDAGYATLTSWSKTLPTGVSWFEHKQALKDQLALVEGEILTQAGRGVINYILAGASAAAHFSTLPGFVKKNITASGPSVYGELDGITVIRVPMTWVDADFTTWDAICVYKGNGQFDTPAVNAPYMPLFVVNDRYVTPNNPLVKQGVAACWTGLKVVCPAFIGKLRITT